MDCLQIEKFIKENQELFQVIEKAYKADVEYGISIFEDKGKLKLSKECVGTECEIVMPETKKKTVAFFHTHPGEHDYDFEREPKKSFSFGDIIDSLMKDRVTLCVGRMVSEDTGDTGPGTPGNPIPLITCSCLIPDKFRKVIRVKKSEVTEEDITNWMLDEFSERWFEVIQ